MNTTVLRSVEDLYDLARQLEKQLTLKGESASARALVETMETSWTTASEAIGELKLCLLEIRSAVSHSLGVEGLSLLDRAVDGATKLWPSSN